MTIVLPALAAGFAAFCVWLAVRIISRRERWAKWALVIPILLATYVLSIGPVAWIVSESKSSDWGWGVYHTVYYPLLRIQEIDYDNLPEVGGDGLFYRAIDWYLSLWGGGPQDGWIET
jgi:hypothetical protein